MGFVKRNFEKKACENTTHPSHVFRQHKRTYTSRKEKDRIWLSKNDRWVSRIKSSKYKLAVRK